MYDGCSFSKRSLLRCLVLLLLTTSICRAQGDRSTLVFYADKDVRDTLWTPLFSAIHEDMAEENFGTEGRSIERNPRLMRSTELYSGEEFGRVIEVKLLGRCDVAQQAYRPQQPGPLGWVLRVRGEIQPYIYVDCARMAQTLNATTLGMSEDQRAHAMSQAISHVLVHEWIHIATQNTGHTEHGITEAQLSASTLVADPAQPRATADSNPEKPVELPYRGFIFASAEK